MHNIWRLRKPSCLLGFAVDFLNDVAWDNYFVQTHHQMMRLQNLFYKLSLEDLYGNVYKIKVSSSWHSITINDRYFTLQVLSWFITFERNTVKNFYCMFVTYLCFIKGKHVLDDNLTALLLSASTHIITYNGAMSLNL